jgi:hypothetical protein
MQVGSVVKRDDGVVEFALSMLRLKLQNALVQLDRWLRNIRTFNKLVVCEPWHIRDVCFTLDLTQRFVSF